MPEDYHEAADLREIADLRERARRARYVAHQINDMEAAKGLRHHAEELECRADALAAKYTSPTPACEPLDDPGLPEPMAALKPEAPAGPKSDPAPAPSSDKPEREPDEPEPEPADTGMSRR